MKTMKKYLSFIAFAIMAVFGLALVSCGGDDDEDDAEVTIVGTREITVNGKTYYQRKDNLGWAYINGTSISCDATLSKNSNYPSMDDYSLNLDIYDCTQGKEVQVERILEFKEPSSTPWGDVDYQMNSGKIVCTKKTSSELNLKFTDVEISEKISYISGKTSTKNYTLNGTLAFEFH